MWNISVLPLSLVLNQWFCLFYKPTFGVSYDNFRPATERLPLVTNHSIIVQHFVASLFAFEFDSVYQSYDCLKEDEQC